jgi:hypothetical protein
VDTERPPFLILAPREGGQEPIRATAYPLGRGLLLTGRAPVAAASQAANMDMHAVDACGSGVRYACSTLWQQASEERTALALLKMATDQGAMDTNHKESSPLTFGRLKGTGLHTCVILAYPRYAQTTELAWTLERIRGTIVVPTGSYVGQLTFAADHPLPSTPAAGTNPLVGMAGAPVFSQGFLIGVAVAVATQTNRVVVAMNQRSRAGSG